jgi:hypothetical protein
MMTQWITQMHMQVRKLNKEERNYSTTEREALSMIFALQKFCHYLLENPFTFFTDHQALKYLVNKPVHQGKICRWLLLFQEFEFDVIIRPGKKNVRPDHLSRLETREDLTGIDDDLPDAHLFRVEAAPKDLEDISNFLEEGKALGGPPDKQKENSSHESCTIHNH